MAEAILTDGLCKITFDPTTIKGFELSPAGPNAKHIRDKSEKKPFASIGVENVGMKELQTGSGLKEKGIQHFRRLIHDLDPSTEWVFRDTYISGRFGKIVKQPVIGIEWDYIIFNHERSEAVCAFNKINDDCICYVVSIYHERDENDEEKAVKIEYLIRSIHPR